MNLSILGRNIFDISFGNRKANLATPPGGMPNARVSKPDDATFAGLISGAKDYLSYLSPGVPPELLELISKLCLIDANFAQAISNIVYLGNNGHQIVVTASSKLQIRKALKRLNELGARIQIDNLINTLFRQLGLYGALSLEWIPLQNLSGIDTFAAVPVHSIRFKHEDGRYRPYQYTSKGDYIELNETTYMYSALEQDESSPYGIPPFIAAIPSGIIQMYAGENLKAVIKMFGLLGFISLSVEPPDQNPGESDEDYWTRSNGYLTDIATNFGNSNYRDGFAVTWNNTELKHAPITKDSRGVSEVQKMIDIRQMSGLKMDPALMGRSYSTTETYAGVVYSKMLNEIDNFRRLIKGIIEKGYQLDLLMSGIAVKTMSLSFSPNSSLKPKEEAETKKVETEDLILQQDAGWISPDQAAQSKGYEKAYMGDFPADSGGDQRASATLIWHQGSSTYRMVQEAITVQASAIDDDPRVGEVIIDDDPAEVDLGPEKAKESRRLRWVREYLKAIDGVDEKARTEIMAEVKKKLKAGEFAASSADDFASKVFGYIGKRHPQLLKKLEAATVIGTAALRVFQYYRLRDKIIDKEIRIPFKLNMADKRAAAFMGKLDNFYVSKYLKNEGATGPILRFLREEYLEGGYEKVDEFAIKFGTKLGNVSKSQLRMIADTGVSRIRNAGHVRQMATFEIKVAEIMEILDRLTCPQCEEVDGRTFTVATADARLQELYALPPAEFNEKVYRGAPEAWKKGGERAAGYAKGKSGDALVEQNIFVPLHSRCRGTLVAR